MSTKLHSFMDIFETEFDVGGASARLRKIVIPLIQRDYAQGRTDPEVSRVRDRFLASLYDAITGAPVILDFIYGDIDADGIMTPLDGQQRLTTLFLLHWYAAKRAGVTEAQQSFLGRFSYETRYSARDFCAELVNFSPSFEAAPSAEIINQAWFPLDWKKDPTISSMLVMLDAIHARFRDVPDLWDRLAERAVTFYFLPIKDMGLTDEIYIKMNSRGKPLTQFEHFKAELEREIRLWDEEAARRISCKIDRTWTDLLWQYRGAPDGRCGNAVDDAFLRYFRFVCDILCYKKGQSPQSYGSDVFELLERYFSARQEDAPAHIAALESFFDCWCHIDGCSNPAEFLTSVMSTRHTPGKITIDSGSQVDILGDCLHTYSDRSGKIRQFPLGRIVLLYAITVYLQHQDSVSRDDFVRRIRIVNNLIQNSRDEISDRLDRNRIPAILLQTDAIILTGTIDDTLSNHFNGNQIQEEKEKMDFLSRHPESAEALFALEDHQLLQGQIGIVGLENLAYAPRFASLFTCGWDQIDCALMSLGDYGQRERNGWRYQYGSSRIQSAWFELFHKSANSGFERTKAILIQLLSLDETFTDERLSAVARAFTTQCEASHLYPWRYYYVKYPVFRPGSYGKLSNRDAAAQPYLFSVMQTRSQWSQNTYMPYLKEADGAHLSRDDMGQRLVYPDRHMICENDAYVLLKNEDNSFIRRIEIAQNAHGIDTEDRIQKLKELLSAPA